MKRFSKRLLSLLLAVAMIFGMMPGVTMDAYATDYIDVTEHTCENGICTGSGAAEQVTTNEFEGKTISILGDSISAFSGVSNSTAFNSTIESNAVYYSAGALGVYRADTWWQQTVDVLAMELLVNDGLVNNKDATRLFQYLSG